MRKYTEQHKRRILTSNTSLKSKIFPGHIVTFEYSKSKTNKNPIVMVLNSNEDGLLHGIVLDYMTAKQADEMGKYLLRELKEIEPDTVITKAVSVALYKLSEDNPKIFYNARLKPYLERKFKQSIYRTYNVKEISNLKVLRYKFEGI